ncbi:hypothetical protein ABZ345_45580 [Lentzea sp. NPDC005914]|uniref:hypothetical protein n=1 Tax=Lentzea sp. NPDC005914 TaxID=3154572 RepID=UPI0033CAE579
MLATERVWATPTEVLRIAEQAAALGGETARLLIITAAEFSLSGEPGGVYLAAFSPDSRTLVTVSVRGKTAQVWDIADPNRPVQQGGWSWTASVPAMVAPTSSTWVEHS